MNNVWWVRRNYQFFQTVRKKVMQLRKMEWIYKDESCFTEKFEQFIGYFFIKMEVLRLDFFRVRF